MNLKQVKDPKTGETVQIDENSQFKLSDQTVDHDTAVQMVENEKLESVSEEDTDVALDEQVKEVISEMGELSESAQNKVKDIIETSVANRVQKEKNEIKEQLQ